MGGGRLPPPGPDPPAPADQCPLCPSTDGRATEIPAADYDVVVFENRFPSLASDPGPVADAGPFRRQPGVGRCEVVCFTSDHGGALARLPVRRIRTVVEVWADRTLELGAIDGVEQVFPFENRGEEIGVTLHHPHGQIYGYPFVAPRTARQLDVARAHRDATGGCRSCSVVEAEADGPRMVARAPGWLAFVPSPPAGRSRSTCSRPATCPTCRPWRTTSATAWPRCSRTSSAASTRCSTSRCPTC